MGWLRINLHIVQIGLWLTHPLSVICYRCFLFTSGTHTHPNSSHLQLTCNQQDKTLEPTSSLSVLHLTHSTLLQTPFSIDLDTLTLNESRTEHICKGHQRHGHPQLATHSTTRSQPTQKWIHNLHTPTEIFCEILLKDELHRRSLLICLLDLSNKQHYISLENGQGWPTNEWRVYFNNALEEALRFCACIGGPCQRWALLSPSLSSSHHQYWHNKSQKT